MCKVLLSYILSPIKCSLSPEAICSCYLCLQSPDVKFGDEANCILLAHYFPGMLHLHVVVYLYTNLFTNK